ncbi:MAG: class I SAM-dependent methyltransferase [bacterium]
MDLCRQKRFEDLYSKEDPWGIKNVYAEKVRLENSFKLIPPKHYPQILELGCSEGAFTSKLLNIGDKIYAVDISEIAINRCKTYFSEFGDKVIFSVQDITELKFEPESFDLITCLEVIYYPPRNFLLEIVDTLYTLLKKDGYILISVGILPGYFKYQEFINLVSRRFKIVKIEPVTTNLFKLGGVIKRIPILSKTKIYELAMMITRKFSRQLVRHLAILATK